MPAGPPARRGLRRRHARDAERREPCQRRARCVVVRVRVADMAHLQGEPTALAAQGTLESAVAPCANGSCTASAAGAGLTLNAPTPRVRSRIVAPARLRSRARRSRFERRLRFLMELTPESALEPFKPALQNRRQRLILKPLDGEEQQLRPEVTTIADC